jgi:hypothetical protein
MVYVKAINVINLLIINIIDSFKCLELPLNMDEMNFCLDVKFT